jgi:hypothetical protein
MIPRLEAVADAIMAFEGWHVGSRSYRNRNPGNLRPTSLADARDEEGYRVFPSLVTGYIALIADLQAKFTGRSRAALGPTATLADMMNVYAPSADHNNPQAYAEFVAEWVSKALGIVVTPQTTLATIWKQGIDNGGL